jgi:L-threonylcarbamoyladenylate synthase
MAPRLIAVDAAAPDPDALGEVAQALRAGAVVAFTTDTVYGLGCDAQQADAARRIFEAKGRAPKHPLILLGHDRDALFRYGAPVAAAEALAARFWPGPLTLVVPVAASLPPEVTGGGTTIGIRIPDHPVALGLLAAFGAPLATTSANRSGASAALTAQEVIAQLGDAIGIVVDGGPSPLAAPSTVLDLTRELPTVVRRGAVTIEQIGEVVGHVVSDTR